MSFDDVRATASAVLQTALPGIPIKFENQKFNRPNAAPWAALTIVEGKSKRISLVQNQWRHLGVITIQLLVPEDTGTQQLNLMMDAAFAAFADKVWSYPLGKLWTYGADKRTRPNINGFAIRTLMVEFQHDEVLS